MLNQIIINGINSNKKTSKNLLQILHKLGKQPEIMLDIYDKSEQLGEYFSYMYSILQMREEQKLHLVNNSKINSYENIHAYSTEIKGIGKMSVAFSKAVSDGNDFSMIPLYSRVSK